MAQRNDPSEARRPVYPSQSEPVGGHSLHSHPCPGPAQQSPYPPPPAAYPPPQQRARNPYLYQYPPQQQAPHRHAQHHYPRSGAQPTPQPMQPDAYRLLPPYLRHYYSPAASQPPARQRAAIACKYRRKRKIRCSGYDSSPDGICQNCARFRQQCLFHPISSQAAFVPASALYGSNESMSIAGKGDGPGQNGQTTQTMLYGAHGQPLGPVGPGGPPQYAYPLASLAQGPPSQDPPSQGPPSQGPPSQGDSSQGYGYSPPGQYPPFPQSGYPPPHQHRGHQQAPQPRGDQSDRACLKRGPPDDDLHSNSNGASHSLHPNAKPRHSVSHDGRVLSSGSFEYQGQGPTSPTASTGSYQSYLKSPNYTNGAYNKSNDSSPAGSTPQSAHSSESPHTAPPDGKTPLPNPPSWAGSPQDGRSGTNSHETLAQPRLQGQMPHKRVKSDQDMLNKLNGKN